MGNVTVYAEPLVGATPTEVKGPALGGGSDAALVQWTATRSGEGDVLLLGCVATPIPGWVEDMRPSIEGRNLGFAISSAERLVGGDVEPRPELGYLALLAPGSAAPRSAIAGELPRTSIGISRTFLGFSAASEVVTCFATCATPHAVAHAGPRTCDESVTRAHLSGEVAPPPAGLALGATTWAIHHSGAALAWAAALTICLGAVAIVTRRRPRSRI